MGKYGCLSALSKARLFNAELMLSFKTAVVLCFLVLVAAPVSATVSPAGEAAVSSRPGIQAFQPGETLIYEISWSRVIAAGTAVMEVKAGSMPDGRGVLKFIVTGRSSGVVDKFIKVYDAVQSVFDPQMKQSLTYNIEENYGTKKKRRVLEFDHVQNTVVSRVNDDQPETLVIPEHALDVLSSFYYLRTMENFNKDKTIVFDVYDGGKIWSVEVYTLGREIVKTPAGEFSTIKIRTYPKYNGVFMNKGEVFLWITDDSRKVPVLMKSTLAVGSFVFTLKDMQQGSRGAMIFLRGDMVPVPGQISVNRKITAPWSRARFWPDPRCQRRPVSFSKTS